MTCPRTCMNEETAAEKSACRTSCSKVDRMVHDILRPSTASAGLILAQTNMLAALGTSAMPRL